MIGCLLLAVLVSALECNPDTCFPAWLSDNACDRSCNTVPCNFDSKQAIDSSSLFQSFQRSDCFFECLLHCSKDQLSNGICDEDCNIKACAFDLGMCSFCAEDCTENMLGNGVCDPACNFLECYLDAGDCECSPGCTQELNSNDECDEACNNPDCNYDNWSCLCAPYCFPFWHGDGYCDYYCNSFACQYDKGDCRCANNCTWALWNNDVCDIECNDVSCSFDDYKCECSPGCTKEKRLNRECDLECSTNECGFDSRLCRCAVECDWSDVGDGVCNQECNTEACGYDSGDCFCVEGCGTAELGDGVCQQACYSQACEWDRGDCGQLNCMEHCTPGLLANGICDAECNFSNCNYDNYKCLCAANCTPEMLQDGNCDSSCNSKQCRFDGGDCGYCASDCFEADFGQGICDSTCNVESCGFDLTDCCGVACLGQEGACSVDCLYSQCGYDSACTDSFLRDAAKYSQLIAQDYNKPLDLQACYDEDSDCNEATLRSFYAGTSTSIACKTEKCFAQFGQGQQCSSSSNCDKCFGDKCLECKSGYYSHYTTCVSKCPPGFIVHSQVSTLCYPLTDISSEDLPDVLFVSATLTGKQYRSSLSVALAEAWMKYTDIYLTDPTTDLQPLSNEETTELNASSKYSPLNKAALTNRRRITLRSHLCSQRLNSNCLTEISVVYLKDPLLLLQVSDFELVFVSVRLDGSKTFEATCEDNYCSYCPFMVQMKDSWFNDQFDRFKVKPLVGNCDSLADKSFIEVSCLGKLTLQNSEVVKFRQQYQSFIKASGTVVLSMTDFESNQVTETKDTAFIVQDCSGCEGCEFTLSKASVTLHNNGYEYRPKIVQSGFLKLLNTETVTIVDTKFAYNLVMRGDEATQVIATQHLLYIKSAKKPIVIARCRFLYNYTMGSLLYVDDTALIYTQQTTSSDTLEESTWEHVKISLSSFEGNTVSNLVTVTMGSQMVNVVVYKLSIVDNFIFESMFAVLHSQSLTDLDVDGGLISLLVGSSRTTLKVLPRYVKFTAVIVTRTYWNEYAIQLLSLANVLIEKTFFEAVGAYTASTTEFNANKIIGFEGAYMLYPPEYTRKKAVCLGNIFADLVNTIRIAKVTLNSMKCSGSTGAKLNKAAGLIDIQLVTVKQVVSGSADGGLFDMKEMADSTVQMTDVEVSDLRNDEGVGVLYLQKSSLTARNVRIYASSSSLTTGFNLSSMNAVTIHSCIFDGLRTEGGTGAAIEASFSSASSPSFTLTGSTFKSCKAISLQGGGLYLSFSSKPLHLNINLCLFTSCYSAGGGSALYIESTANISPTSAISNSKFTANEDTSKGSLTAYIANSLVIKSCEFSNNFKSTEVLALTLTTSESRVKLHLCSLTANTAQAVISLQGVKGASFDIASTVFDHNVVSECVHIQDTVGSFNSCVFSNNTGPLQLITGTVIAIDTTFTKNTNENPAGAVDLFESSVFECDRCTFSDNQAVSGGALRVDSRSRITITNSIITGNKSSESGSVAYIINSKQPNLIENTSIYGNRAAGLGSFSLIESYLTLSKVTFNTNQSIAGCPGIVGQSSILTIRDSVFSNQDSIASVFFNLVSNSSGFFIKTAFSFGRSSAGSGVGDFQNSIGQFDDVEFTQIQSYNGILTCTVGSLKIVGITATLFKSSLGGSLAKLSSAKLEVHNSTISDFQQTAIWGLNFESLLINNCTFQRGDAADYTILDLSGFNSAVIKASIFRNNVANSSTAGIRLLGSEATVEIQGCVFMNNTALYIGAVNADVKAIKITNSTFANNSAYLGDAGAIKLGCEAALSCEIAVSFCNFTGNSASANGGAIYWTRTLPILSNNRFADNTAAYGPNIASFPIRLEINEFPSKSRELKVFASGQESDGLLLVKLLDHQGQVVTTDNLSTAVLTAYNMSSVSIQGNLKAVANRGTFTFSEIKVTTDPNTTASLLLMASSLKYPTGLEVFVRPCVVGEALVSKECKVCETGTYSLDPTVQCKDCPTGAKCLGNHTMLPKAGYWRASNLTDTFLACYWPDACLGGVDDLLDTGKCAEGYTGVMCQSCAPDYTRQSRDQCAKCPDQVSNIIIITAIALSSSGISILLIYLTIKSAYRPSSLTSVYFKILMNYFQLVMLASSFDLKWPIYVIEFMAVQRTVGGFSDQAYSFDCLQGKSSFFLQIKFLSVLPVAILIASALTWLCLFFCKKVQHAFNKFVMSFVVLLFLLHPSLLKSMFAVFTCIKVEGKYWLRSDMEITCWDQAHTQLAFCYALPSICLWCVGLPFSCLIYLTKVRGRLNDIDVKLKMGFLCNGYSVKHFYWEFVILYRKVLVIFFSVFMSSAVTAQALTALILLLLSFLMQYSLRPYISKELNNIELKSILTATITIYCGLYYLTQQIEQVTKYFLFVLLISFNLYFILSWLWAAFSQVFLNLFSKSRKLQVCLEKLRLSHFVYRWLHRVKRTLPDQDSTELIIYPEIAHVQSTNSIELVSSVSSPRSSASSIMTTELYNLSQE